MALRRSCAMPAVQRSTRFGHPVAVRTAPRSATLSQQHPRSVAVAALRPDLSDWMTSYKVTSPALLCDLEALGATTLHDLQFLPKEQLDDFLGEKGARSVQQGRLRAAVKGYADLRQWQTYTGGMGIYRREPGTLQPPAAGLAAAPAVPDTAAEASVTVQELAIGTADKDWQEVEEEAFVDLATGQVPMLSSLTVGDQEHNIDPEMTYTVEFSGGSTNNHVKGGSGPAGAVAIIRTASGALVSCKQVALGAATNNMAQFQGAIIGVQEAKRLGVRKLELVGDSELVVQQLNGGFACKHPRLVPLHETLRNLMGQFDSWSIRHKYSRDIDPRLKELRDEAVDMN